jgi:hypothetical protein
MTAASALRLEIGTFIKDSVDTTELTATSNSTVRSLTFLFFSPHYTFLINN